MTNAINWFEIPATDFDRAKTFYSKVLGAEIQEIPMPEFKYGTLPYNQQENGIGGAIIQGEGMNPSQDGSTVYLNGGNDLSQPLSRIEEAGGQIIMPKTAIGENGFIAQFIDTEGNRVALHSMN